MATKTKPLTEKRTGKDTVAKDTLSITDNRTGEAYEVPIENGSIRALDLRQIKENPDDFGLMTYDCP